jgi:hypothetical protein
MPETRSARPTAAETAAAASSSSSSALPHLETTTTRRQSSSRAFKVTTVTPTATPSARITRASVAAQNAETPVTLSSLAALSSQSAIISNDSETTVNLTTMGRGLFTKTYSSLATPRTTLRNLISTGTIHQQFIHERAKLQRLQRLIGDFFFLFFFATAPNPKKGPVTPPVDLYEMKKAAAPKAAPKEASKSASPRKSSQDGSQDMFASQEAVEEQRQSSQMSQTPSSSSFPEPGGKNGGSNNNPFESYQEVVQRLNQQKRQQQTQTQTQTQQKVSTPSPRKTSSVCANWTPPRFFL